MVRPTNAVSTAAAVVLASSGAVMAWPRYTPLIPNGANVPGFPNLGHINENGRGGENAFGTDFAVYGDDWTMEYCMADSDGDGQTNGQELGDPCCAFSSSSNPVVLWTSGISHPSDAASTSDSSLWASIDCSGGGASTTTSTDTTSTTSTGTASGTTSEDSTTEEESTQETGEEAGTETATSSSTSTETSTTSTTPSSTSKTSTSTKTSSSTAASASAAEETDEEGEAEDSHDHSSMNSTSSSHDMSDMSGSTMDSDSTMGAADSNSSSSASAENSSTTTPAPSTSGASSHSRALLAGVASVAAVFVIDW